MANLRVQYPSFSEIYTISKNVAGNRSETTVQYTALQYLNK